VFFMIVLLRMLPRSGSRAVLYPVNSPVDSLDNHKPGEVHVSVHVTDKKDVDHISNTSFWDDGIQLIAKVKP